ncbi:hypothetical protein Mucpa_6378 [Mucilaginibacter paludis DSM 18603]|uniref:Peptidase A2 domain-containing protein n=2 Tax=Mucilaginibacter TaxID=423349 RepID=H1Y7U6_9SPHI|nr:hypothetical protein Mucpa_6378 [Mucilaginibacter paludis DSM 18603]
MKYPIVFILFMAINTLGLAQNMNYGGLVTDNYYEELPYEFINGKIVIEIEIGGHQKKFLLDTGAPCQISREIADELNIGQKNSSKVIDAYGNTNINGIDLIKSIKLGGTEFNNVPTLIGIPEFFKCIGVEGIIGSNLLRKSIIQFISSKKTVVITDDLNRLPFKPSTASRLNTKADNQSSPFIQVKIGDQLNGEFLFDTGDSGLMMISNSYMDNIKQQNIFRKIATGYGANSFGENGAEQRAIKYRISFHNMTIGNIDFKNVITETAYNNHQTGTIGSKLLNYGTITIDFIHAKFYADPTNTENDLNEKSWPLSPAYSDHKLVTGIVWEKLKDSVKPGMQIIAIDGVACEQIDLCNLLTQKSLLFGKEHATITIKNDSGTITKLVIDKE